jgi:hypothetical protein
MDKLHGALWDRGTWPSRSNFELRVEAAPTAYLRDDDMKA